MIGGDHVTNLITTAPTLVPGSPVEPNSHLYATTVDFSALPAPIVLTPGAYWFDVQIDGPRNTDLYAYSVAGGTSSSVLVHEFFQGSWFPYKWHAIFTIHALASN